MFKNILSVGQPTSPYVLWGVRAIFSILLIIIIWKSIEPITGKSAIPHMDKILHFGAYAALCFVALSAKLLKEQKVIVGVVILIGLSMEVLQGLMGMGRSASVGDFIANTLGALTSYWIYRRLK